LVPSQLKSFPNDVAALPSLEITFDNDGDGGDGDNGDNDGDGNSGDDDGGALSLTFFSVPRFFARFPHHGVNSCS
jgi:hypothetical protein